MKIYHYLSIRNKLIGIILLVTIFALGSGFTIDIVHDIRTFKKDMVNHTIATAQVIGDYCSGALLFGDNEGAEKILEKLTAVPSIVNAIVYNTNGELFATLADVDDNLIAPPTFKKQSSQFIDNYLHVFQPIFYNDEFYGMIYLCSSTTLLNEKIMTHLQNMVFLIVGLTIISIFLAFRLQRIISQPILHLANIAKQITKEGNYSIRVQKIGNDETGILYDGFNNMLDQIQDREKERDKAEEELARHRDHLEDLVKIRTTELTDANKQLRQEIEERKRAEEMVRANEETYRIVIEQTGQMVYDSDIDTGQIRWLGDVEGITGYTSDEFMKVDIAAWEELIHPDDRELTLEMLDETMKKGYKFNVEYRLKSKDGTYLDMKDNGVFLKDKRGNVYRMLGTMKDFTEHNRIEEARRENEVKFESIGTSAQDAIIIMDNDGKISYWNDAASRTFGYTKEEAIGKELHRFLAPERFHEAYERTFSKFQKTGQGAVVGKTTELEGIRKDSTEFPFELSLSSVKIKNKWNAIGILRDISQRKQAEEALQALSSRNEAILAAVPDIIMEVDSKKVYTWANKTGIEFFGEDVLGKEAAFYFEGEQDTYNRVQPLFNGGENIIYVESYQRRKDGEKRLLAWWCRVLKDVNGDMIGALSTARDITDQKRAEEALRQSEEKYRSLVANIPDITWTNDCEGKMVFISPNVEKVYGFTPEEIYKAGNRLSLGRIHPDDVEGVIEAYRMLFEKNEIYDVVYRIQRKDGKWIWLHDRAIGTYEKDGIMYADGVLSDITEQVHTEQELKDTQAQLAQSEKMAALGTLVAGVAHEINTPIGAINSMYDTLMRVVEKLKCTIETTCSGDRKELQKVGRLFKIIDDANQVIASGTNRVTNIVRRLKSFARLDEAALQEVDIHEGIEDTLVIVHHELKHKVVVERNFGDISPISCYPSRLNQVYLNILINAVQAIKDKGTITITTFQKNDQVHIQFKDTGVGIPEEKLKKIFDPGYTTKGVGVGTGLGLSICYQIIKDHQGEIRVESKVGKGTVFTIILPIIQINN